MDYLYLSGECSALMNTLIPNQLFVKLAGAESFDDALEILKGTSYGALLQSMDVEEALAIEQNKLNEFIKTECPDPLVIKFFLLPYDYDNLEVISKARSLGLAEDSYLEISGTYDFDFLKNAVRQKRYKPFGNEFIRHMLIEYNNKSSQDPLTAREVDYIFQKYKFENLSELFGHKKGLMRELCDFILDYENISIAYRCATLDELKANVVSFGSIKMPILERIVGGDTYVLREMPDLVRDLCEVIYVDKNPKNLARFELLKRKTIIKLIEPYLYDPSTEATFVYYVERKLFEIENLHLIMNLHKENLPSRIKSRLIEIGK